MSSSNLENVGLSLQIFPSSLDLLKWLKILFLESYSLTIHLRCGISSTCENMAGVCLLSNACHYQIVWASNPSWRRERFEQGENFLQFSENSNIFNTSTRQWVRDKSSLNYPKNYPSNQKQAPSESFYGTQPGCRDWFICLEVIQKSPEPLNSSVSVFTFDLKVGNFKKKKEKEPSNGQFWRDLCPWSAFWRLFHGDETSYGSCSSPAKNPA